jgi:hypothetical protein
MAAPTTDELHNALINDLKNAGTAGTANVVNDVARKTFTARIGTAVLEFSHKQADAGFWNGVKYYGSGPNSRIRIRRSAAVIAPVAGKPLKKAAPQRAKAKAGAAA